MSERDVYDRFVDWLRQNRFPVPADDITLPLVKAGFTPEEAALLTGIPFSDTSLEELAGMKQMDPVELGRQLDVLTKKGALFRTVEGEPVRYGLGSASYMLHSANLWPGLEDERTKAMAPLANRFYYHSWDAYKYTQHKTARVLPIDGAIEDTSEILPFEDVAKVLETKEYFCVTTCPCRHRKNVDPDSQSCKHSTVNCLHFDGLARYIVENDMGREITHEETHEILRQSAEEGMVYTLSNVQDGAATICTCCQCCCVHFEAIHKLGHADGPVPSNYRVRVNSGTCVGCGLCVRRCPMHALSLEDAAAAKGRITKVKDKTGKVKELKNKKGRIAVLEPELCIGCGVCAYKCPTQSLVLERREVITYPPKDGRELGELVAADLEAGEVKQRIGT